MVTTHDTESGRARSSSRHPSPQPYPAPPTRGTSTARPHNGPGDRTSLAAVPQLELHRDVSNPFNRTSVSLDRAPAAPTSADHGQNKSQQRPDVNAPSSSDIVASRPPPLPPSAASQEGQSSNSSTTAVHHEGGEDESGKSASTELGGRGDDGLPPVIATDYCESPAAIGLPKNVGGTGNITTGSGSSAGRGKDEGMSRDSDSGSHQSHTKTSTSKASPPTRSRADSALTSSSTGSSSRPRVLSGLSPSIRSKLPSIRRDAGGRDRTGSLLPLPATTHREPTTRSVRGRGRQGSVSSSTHTGRYRRTSVRTDNGGSGSSSSTSAISTSRSQHPSARRRSNQASASPDARARRQSCAATSDGSGSDSETEVEHASHRPRPPHGMSGTEMAAGAAAASLVRRMTGGQGDRQSRQNSRAPSSNSNRGESFYARQARMVRNRSEAKTDDEMLRQQMAEDGLIMDDDGNIVNRDRGWSNPPSRGGSGDKEKNNASAGRDDEEGQNRREENDRDDERHDQDGQGDTSVPSMPRRATFGQSVSYTSTVVYTSIFADIKNDSIAMAGEFVGTILFLITSLGAAQAVASMHQEGDGPPDPQASTIENLIGTFYKAFATGTALYGTASIFYRFTGSIFNPSVSLALALTGVIRPVRFLPSQMLGGIVAAYILHGLVPGQTEINLKLSASANIAQGLFIETFATTTLILAVLMLGVEKHLVTPHAPLGFGLTLSASMLFAMPYTGAGINVARAFGTALVQGFQPYHWIYWLGPTIGAFLASAFYVFLRYIQYWEVNPGQDSTQPLTGPPEFGRKLRKKAGMRKRDVLSPKK